MAVKFLISLGTALVLFMSNTLHASVINGGELLDGSGANFLEERLGLGSLDFTNISNLSRGASTSVWHADVFGYTNVISIYDVIFQGNNYLIGGFSSIGHDGNSYSYNQTTTANNFIFNISLGFIHNTQAMVWSGQYDQYDSNVYFATFGGGHDLFGGSYVLGNAGYINASNSYNNGYSYGGSQHLLGSGVSGFQNIIINGLESYTFAPSSISAVNIPVPSTLAILGLGLLGAGFSRKKITK